LFVKVIVRFLLFLSVKIQITFVLNIRKVVFEIIIWYFIIKVTQLQALDLIAAILQI